MAPRPYHQKFSAFILARAGNCAPEESSLQPLKVGDLAPDFDLPCALGEEKQQVKLSDFRGQKHVVLAFYALDWTPT